jgi:pyruvate dehydrogenase complex dehydrogenase (E1) component
LSEEGQLPASTVAQAIDKYKLQAEKINPLHA